MSGPVKIPFGWPFVTPVRPRMSGKPTAKKKQFVSVGTKLTGATLIVLILVTAFTYFQVSRNEREQLLSAKTRAAMMVTELFTAGVSAPLSFGDEPGIHEHVALLMANANIVYVGVWSVDSAHRDQRGEKLGESSKIPINTNGGSSPQTTKQTISTNDVDVERTNDMLIIEQRVHGDASHEVLGVVRIGFSLQRENAAIEAAKSRTLFTALAMGLGLACVLLVLIRTVIVRRLEQLSNAAKLLEEGHKQTTHFNVDTNDEVGALSRAFKSMADTLATREERISARNRDLRNILDNVAEGLMTVKKDGTMADERSRILDVWFGPPADPKKFFEYFEGFAPTTARWLRIGWNALNDDCMPVEVIFDQMPCRFEYRERFYELSYLPIWKGPEADQIVDEVLVVVRDVTSIERRERAEQEQRVAMNVFRRILADRAGFAEFFRQGTSLVVAIEDASSAKTTFRSTLRYIHTLKGNTSLFGLEQIADVCHRIESRIIDEGGFGAPTRAELAEIRTAWDYIGQLSKELQLPSDEDRIELSTEEYAAHLSDLESVGASAREILAAARGWANEPATRRLERIAEQGRSIAKRVGKAETQIEVSAPAHLRLPAARWEGFWSVFTHVLRNTLDHGIESSTERLSSGKSRSGKITIALSEALFGGGVELSVVDDGRGIAWEKIRARAAKLGLPCATADELEEALYSEKVTSQSKATTMSGRGVGMGAVRDFVRSCGGTMSIETADGVGTTLRFHFPRTMMLTAAEAVANVA